MVNEAQEQKAHYIILDTSFLISYRQNQFWTGDAFHDIKSPGTNVVIPRGVEAEYDRIMGISASHNDSGGIYKSIANLLSIERLFAYKDNLRETLSSKLDQCVDAWGRPHGTLSKTDKTIVQAVTDYLKHGDSVAVASSDWAIVAEVESIEFENNAEIPSFSPWRKPRVNGPLDLLVSGNVYTNLPKLEELDSSSARAYLAVMPDQHIGGGVRFDIAFDLYISRTYGVALPKIGSGHYLRFFDRPLQNVGLVSTEMMGLKQFAAYDPTQQSPLIVIRNPNPLPIHERKRICARPGKTYGRVKESAVPKIELQESGWARIEDDDIGRHDKVTVGRLQEMRRKLNGTNGHH